MALAVQASIKGAYTDRLWQENQHDWSEISTSFPRGSIGLGNRAIFFGHSHHLIVDVNGEPLDLHDSGSGLGIMGKNGLNISLPLSEISKIISTLECEIVGWTVVGETSPKLVPSIVEVNDGEGQSSRMYRPSDKIAGALRGTYAASIVSTDGLPNDYGLVETEVPLIHDGKTATRSYFEPATHYGSAPDMNSRGVLIVKYSPHMAMKHAHVNNQYTDETYHSHWNE